MNHPAIEIKYEPADDILTRYEILKKQNPEMRARQMAETLGTSEGELLACQIGESVTRLKDATRADFQEILKDIVNLDEVMALTRNEDCVSERKGIYKDAQFFSQGKMAHGLFVNPDIDLRLFMSHWKFCFAVSEGSEKKPRKSLQFFDKSGTAIHKIYLTNKSNYQAFDDLLEKHINENQENFIDIEEYEAKAADRNDDQIDWEGLKETWKNLKDTHDFFPMIRKFKVGRKQALINVGKDFAYEVKNDSSRKMLEFARDEECEIMVFVGNRAAIQIHTGNVKKLAEYGKWFNVLDPKFNLHLNEESIASSWVTKKPTVDGIVTALEIFDKNNELIVTFFGKRKPGIPELALWRKIIEQIPAK
jgi:putative hemin transport protein